MMLALTIDLDPLWCYRAIYGLPAAEPADGITATAAERFRRLAAELGMRGTLFTVGATLDDEAAAASLAAAAAAGHEIACHSHEHHYDLSRRPEEEMADDLRRANEAIQRACGSRPRGFRAPGYLLGERLLPVCERLGFAYDSSVLPAPLYQGAKGLARLLLGAAGRRSASLPGDARESLAPAAPYRPDPHAPWRRGEGRLLELPISTVLGVPLTGAVLALLGPSRTGWLAGLLRRRRFVCLELHGLDLMDIAADGLDPGLRLQPDARLPWQRKYEAVLNFCRPLLDSHRPVTLAGAARLLAGEEPGEDAAPGS